MLTDILKGIVKELDAQGIKFELVMPNGTHIVSLSKGRYAIINGTTGIATYHNIKDI